MGNAETAREVRAAIRVNGQRGGVTVPRGPVFDLVTSAPRPD